MPPTPAYSTLEDLAILYPLLPTSKAEQLLAATEALVEHARFEPDGVAETSDRQLWVDTGYERIAGLDTWITRLERWEVTQSSTAAEVRTAVKTMDEALERQEAEAARRAEEERKRLEEEERRRVAEQDRLARESAERQRREEEEEQRLQANRRHGTHDQEQDEDEDEDEDVDENENEEDNDDDVPIKKIPAQPKTAHPPVIEGRDHEVCTACTTKTARSKKGPCGGPRRYAAKVSCGLCHHNKKGCSFNDDGPPKKRKRTTRDREDKGEGSSRMSRLEPITIDDDTDEEERSRATIGLGKRVARRDEKEDPSERLKRAYQRVGQAEVELAKAKIAMDNYIMWKRTHNL